MTKVYRTSVVSAVAVMICLVFGMGIAAGQATPAPTQPPTAQATANAVPAMKGKILYQSNRSGVSQLLIMDADGTHTHQLTWGNGSFTSTWSPDGKRIAYSSVAGNAWELFVMNADGSNSKQLTHNGQRVASPSWSPDGKHIVFELDGPKGSNVAQIYLIDPNGTHEINLSNNTGYETYPSWSPEGQSILFTTNRDNPKQIRLSLMNLDGTHFSQFSDVKCAGEAQFSPDGQKVAYVNFCENKGEIHVVDAQGQNDHRLTENTTFTGNPRWTNDGQHIVYAWENGGALNIYVMDADGGNVTQLTKDGGIFPAVQPSGLRAVSASAATVAPTLSATASAASTQTSNP